VTGPLPADSATVPKVTAIVVAYNTRDDVLACLGALERHAGLPFEAVVVDNASADGTVAAVRAAQPAVQVIANVENVGFARACNQGIRAARASYVLLINGDAEVRPGAVEALVGLLDARPDVGVVAPRTRNEDGTPQVSFGRHLTPVGEWRQRRLVRGVRAREPRALRVAEETGSREQEPGWVSGACMLARREAVASVGLFDEGFFLYEEDVDLCLRLRCAGWRIVFTPAAEVVHRLGRSMETAPERSRLEYHRSHLRFYRKHNGVLATTALRTWMGICSAVSWLGALGPGPARLAARTRAATLGRLAILGR
jgi:N-acetylglucosaminyl-diphospho-decaprenol L-rhamnosyltransferase